MSQIPQTVVNASPDFGLPGQLADLHSARTAKIDTALQAEASAGIPFGTFVKRGTNSGDAKVPSAKTDVLFGIAVFGQSYARPYEVDSTGIRPKAHFDVLRNGTVWVLPTEDVVEADQVHVRVTVSSDTYKLPGTIGKTDDGVKTIDITPFARWESQGTATTLNVSGTPAKLWIDMVNVSLAVTDS